MKKAISVFTCIALLLSLFAPMGAFAKSDKTFSALIEYDGALHEYTGTGFSIFVNKNRIDTPIPPIVIENGRAVVPVREIFESLGATVTWIDGSPSRVKISYGKKNVTLTIGNKSALVDGEYVTMETGARLIVMNGIGKTMVPVRFVGEMLDMDVDYDEKNASISINSKASQTEPEKPADTQEQNSLVSLVTENRDTTLTVTVKTSAAIQNTEQLELENPNRYVIDIKNCKLDVEKKTYNIYSNISKIRLGNFEGSARIVLDAEEMPEVSVTYSADRKTMTIKAVSQKSAVENAKGPLVLIDPGHGGEEPGAIAYNADGTVRAYEKDINLAISKEVIDILKSKGVNVAYTRITDKTVSLAERVKIASDKGASLFVSVHCNAYTSSEMNGSLILHHTTKDYSDYGATGYDLARNIRKYLSSALNTVDKGYMNGDKMYVIRNSAMPAVIVENAFMTNEADLKKLLDENYRNKAAEAIANGILDTLPYLTK